MHCSKDFATSRVDKDSNDRLSREGERSGSATRLRKSSCKLGYDWLNIYVNKILVRQVYVEQAVKAGTEDSPIVWASGMALIQNAYYTHNGEIKVWMGAAGATAKWTDAAFVPI